MNTHLKLALLVAGLFVSFFVGAAIIQAVEAPHSHYLLYFDAYYFCVSVATTTGYGHVYPVTTGGKFFMMFYAMASVPLLIIILADIGRKLANLIGMAEAKVLRGVKSRHLRFFLVCALTVISGLVIFLIIPGAIFTQLEHYWSFMDGFYYSFVTLSTIGFGDLVAGMDARGAIANNVYVVALSIYTVLGLTFPATLWVLVSDYLYGSKGTEQGQGEGPKTEAVGI